MKLDMSTLSGTVTSGIQDISALLPLLGTEQCEEHTGSALTGGFLYMCITPISVFGSLGIVKAGFNVLLASIVIPSIRFMGARNLADGGFKPKGQVTPLIAFDPDHQNRYLAESQLEKMLQDEHIGSAEDLTVEANAQTIHWNFQMILFTVLCSTLGIVPYLHIIITQAQIHTHSLISGLTYPLIRIFGSCLTGLVVQLLLQIRILLIVKKRLIFTAVDRVAKDKKIPLYNQKWWNSQYASEACLWDLDKFLQSRTSKTNPRSKHKPYGESADSISHQDVTELMQYVSEETKRHFPSHSRLTQFMKSGAYFVLPILLVVGMVSSVVGYLGCFSLVNLKTPGGSSVGPIVWLAIEVVLCLFRILVWAINPAWDDSKGISFKLKLVSHCPLVTCSLSGKELEDMGRAPVYRSKDFLEEITAYTGPFQTLNWRDTALYYIFVGEQTNAMPHNDSAQKILYIVLSDYKEQTSRLFVKRSSGNLQIYLTSLVPDPRSRSININTNFKDSATTPDSHFLTSDPTFVAQISEHYDEIVRKVTTRNSGESPFHRTWAINIADDHESDTGRSSNTLQNNGQEDLKVDDVDEGDMGISSHPKFTEVGAVRAPRLTEADIYYMKQGQLERSRNNLSQNIDRWIERLLEQYSKDLLEEVPPETINDTVTIMVKYESDEIEHLMINARQVIESLFHRTSQKWEELISDKSEIMVEKVLNKFFPKTDEPIMEVAEPKAVLETKAIADTKARKKKLQERLEGEARKASDDRQRSDREGQKARFERQREVVRARIHDRKYYAREGQRILEKWAKWEEEQETETERSIMQDFYDAMNKRLQEGRKEVENAQDLVKLDMKARYERMRSRCFARSQELHSTLLKLADEFADAKEGPPSLELFDPRKYWDNQAIDERIRISNKNQKLLIVSDDSLTALGGFDNMIQALRRSREFSAIQFACEVPATSDSVSQIASVVREVKRLTAVYFTWPSNLMKRVEANVEIDEEEASAKREALLKLINDTAPVLEPLITANLENATSQGRSSCRYEDVTMTDYYRKGRPYLLLQDSGCSRCTIKFRIVEKRDLHITLRHCFTTSVGKIEIAINDHTLEQTWGKALDDFLNEDVLLPRDHLKAPPDWNILTITLAPESTAVYWLSDIYIHPGLAEELSEADHVL